VRSEAEFAARLRSWRRRWGWSQLERAGRAGISQRHLSFLEIGRAAPSRDMVARLATRLDVALRQHNELLVAAGFAPVWHETEFAAPGLTRVRDALDYMLARPEDCFLRPDRSSGWRRAQPRSRLAAGHRQRRRAAVLPAASTTPCCQGREEVATSPSTQLLDERSAPQIGLFHRSGSRNDSKFLAATVRWRN
jgi:transcriptional regulator with XRE-family HTH domain